LVLGDVADGFRKAVRIMVEETRQRKALERVFLVRASRSLKVARALESNRHLPGAEENAVSAVREALKDLQSYVALKTGPRKEDVSEPGEVPPSS